MKIRTMDDQFMHNLGDIYDAEHRFLEAQQELLSSATDSTLKGMIQEHIQQTKGHIDNLEQVYKEISQRPERVTCDAAVGLVKEGSKSVKETEEPALRDNAILCAISKVEHYEISNYRSLITFCDAYGADGKSISTLLKKNLTQEEHTAEKAETALKKLISQGMPMASAR